MSNFKEKWNKSYSQGDNNILYPQIEVIKFINRFICKRNNNEAFTRILNKKNQPLRGLDFGCGIGTHAIMFNDFEIESYGIDISNTAISIAIRNAKKKGFKNHNFIVQSSKTHILPFKDNYFDFVVAEASLDSMPLNLAKLYISELKRVTNGVIYASFIGRNHAMNKKDEFVVKTKHEEGTIQTIFNQKKIYKLFDIDKKNFIYFSCNIQTDCLSKKLMSKRYYVVAKFYDFKL